MSVSRDPRAGPDPFAPHSAHEDVHRTTIPTLGRAGREHVQIERPIAAYRTLVICLLIAVAGPY